MITQMMDASPWVMLALLGAYHGINPGMGWLFAVALGLQERSRAAVLRAFAPIALGHAVSIAVVVGIVAALQTVVSPYPLRLVGAGLLIAYGVYKLVAPMSHPRWVGMRVGFRDLAVWSFLMATAHGAGLMLVPILLKLPSDAPKVTAAVPAAAHNHDMAMAMTSDNSHESHEGHEGHGGHENHAAQGGHSGMVDPNDHSQHLRQSGISGPIAGIAAIVVHTGAMFLTMALVALVVYEKVGLAILRRAWFNLDLLWAVALIGAGILTFFL